MLARRIVFGLIALAALFYLLFRTPEPGIGEAELVERQFPAMGTWFTASVWLDKGQSREAADAALDAYAQQWRPFGDGALARINAALAAGERAGIPEDMQPLFAAAESWRRDTGGAFDTRLGALVALWGFDDEERFRSTPPDEADIAALREALHNAPGYDGGDGYGPAPEVQFNFGAIAKGDAIARASQALTAAGFHNHILNGGGDLIARGVRGDRNWRVAVRHPRPGLGRGLLAALDIGDEAVFTSGDYERHFEHRGRRYHHILDPAAGMPAETMQSVTVVHPDPVFADAASTALFVAGTGWRALAEALGAEVVLVVDAAGEIDMTHAAAQRFRIIER